MVEPLKKKTEGAKWALVDELPGILCSLRTAVKTSTAHASFMLVYGTKALIPIKVGLTNMRLQGISQHMIKRH